MGISLYIHIPFCTTKCRYCDFISYPAGKSHKFSEYIFALGREMELLSRQYGQIDVDTVYLGGGTPSLLPETHIKDILARINSFFLLAKSAEITIEANPETLDKEKLATYRSLGINRLSIGAQTAANDLLADMGRGHSWKDVINVTVWAREAGFTNIGLDLIYGLPGQSLTQWRKTLVQAADIRPQHLSVYGLKLSPGTAWGDMEEAGQLVLPGDDEQAEMYLLARTFLAERGYRHYEISNFALQGFEARHNLTYWKLRPYLGVGVAAASFMEHTRWTNSGSLAEYILNLKERKLAREELLYLDDKEEMIEYMIMGLRLVEGISREDFFSRFHLSLEEIFGNKLASLTARDLLEEKQGRIFIPTEAFAVANEVFVAFV